jgi:D-glutamate cyclase
LRVRDPRKTLFMDAIARQKLELIEAVMVEGAARNAAALAPYAAGNLAGFLTTLLQTPNPCIAILSGFWILHSKPPAAETDGPVGAALLGKFFKRLGWRALGVTDVPCEGPMRAAFEFAGLEASDIYIAKLGGRGEAPTPIETVGAWLKGREATHLLSIERPGVSADGRYYNMRGVDLTPHVYPFDPLFHQPAYVTAAIGDGGNEIGMGSIPGEVVAREIEHGAKIASITPSAFTLVCGVSNWGATMIAAGLSVLSPECKAAFDAVFSESAELEALARVSDAGAVDGVSGRRALSVDGMAMDTHFAKYREMRAKLATFQGRA